jgi:hypothetical protein
MIDFLTGALKARGAFWLKCKKPLKMHFRGLLINSVVARKCEDPVQNISRFKDTFP